MVTPEYVKELIATGLACEHLEVAGDGSHFEAVIVSAAFDGKSRVARHQIDNAWISLPIWLPSARLTI